MTNFNKESRSNGTGPLKAIIYCRVASAAEAGKDLALLSQELTCRAHAAGCRIGLCWNSAARPPVG